MDKTILIYVVLLTIYSNEATNSSEPDEVEDVKCATPYSAAPDNIYCGTDARDYHYLSYFECKQKTKYGKRINLQLKHRGRCWIWEKYGYETYAVIFVSKFEVNSVLIEYRSLVLSFHYRFH